MVALKTDVSILSVSSCQWDTYIEPMPKANDNAIFFRLFIWRWNRTTAGYTARYKSVNADKAGQMSARRSWHQRSLPTASKNGKVDKNIRTPALLVGNGERPLGLDRRALGEENNYTSNQSHHATSSKHPEKYLV